MTQTKQELRKRLRKLRAAIPAEERERADAGIARQVMELPEYAGADTLFAYLDFGPEVRTRDIMADAWERGKTVVLPRCVPGTRQMTWHKVDSFDGLVRSSLGVEEPAPDPATRVDPAGTENALVLVPGLTFDPQGYRMGYGGGFYDVFLSGFAGCTVGLCRDAQFCDHVEALDPHDLPARIVVTETRVFRPGASQ